MAMRVEGWEAALFGYLRAARRRPFEWGKFDCCLFAADVIAALTGVDPAADLRGHYRTARGAKRIVNREGGSLAALAERRFAPLGITPLKGPKFARRGDILLLQVPGIMRGFGGLGAVCLGAEVAYLTPDGLEMLPLTAAADHFAARGWRV